MKALRPFHQPSLRALTCSTLPHRQRRTFLPNPFGASNPFNALNPQPQTLTATRTLPYAATPLYNIIADVSSYSSFLPYCQSSTVTQWSNPDSQTQKRWPSEAKLAVGWGSITESFTSKIYCVPGKVVEAVDGASSTTLSAESIRHHTETTSRGDPQQSNPLLTHLLTRWTLEPLAGKQDQTEVNLSIEFAFANPIYTTLSAGAAPKVAEMMIRAFEERVRALLGEGGQGTVEAAGKTQR